MRDPDSQCQSVAENVLAVGYNGQGGVPPHPVRPGGGRRAEESIQ